MRSSCKQIQFCLYNFALQSWSSNFDNSTKKEGYSLGL